MAKNERVRFLNIRCPFRKLCPFKNRCPFCKNKGEKKII